ncbi:cysteine and tyrosine-rich protein 1-like [Saccostrea echinata]|uniref:cysteine and tyrosine-rich protein 1-like n=1 Tax=Saccostrea echinata TaxID=191078 RepID=UPI002A817F1E|nr:cysteine and tyrosine-rich protein 1-like [Saccostrea echinata]
MASSLTLGVWFFLLSLGHHVAEAGYYCYYSYYYTSYRCYYIYTYYFGASSIAGVVIGMIVFVGILVFVCVLIKKHQAARAGRVNHIPVSTVTTVHQAPPPQPQGYGYGGPGMSQPYNPNAGYPPSGPPTYPPPPGPGSGYPPPSYPPPKY